MFTQGLVPVNPWMANGYFLYGLTDNDSARLANNTLLARCDQLWVFGPVSDGVAVEIDLASGRGMPVRYFTLSHDGEQITHCDRVDLPRD